jgi:pimeloyl-ACP methyl ester carboxylesterase
MATQYHDVTIDDIIIFYREAGPKDAPVILMLHGFPSSSHMFRALHFMIICDRTVCFPVIPMKSNWQRPAR